MNRGSLIELESRPRDVAADITGPRVAPSWPTGRGRELSRQFRWRHRDQVDLRSDGRGMAPLDRHAEATFFLRREGRPEARPRRRDRESVVELGQARDDGEVAAYAASKITILSITRSFAYALASRPARVNAVLPGIVLTPMQEEVLEKSADARALSGGIASRAYELVPLGRGSSPQECVVLIWLLLSDESLHDWTSDQLHRRP